MDFPGVRLLQHPLRNRVHRVRFAPEEAVRAHRLARLRLRRRATGHRNDRVAVCERLHCVIGGVVAPVVYVVNEQQRGSDRGKIETAQARPSPVGEEQRRGQHYAVYARAEASSRGGGGGGT